VEQLFLTKYLRKIFIVKSQIRISFRLFSWAYVWSKSNRSKAVWSC